MINKHEKAALDDFLRGRDEMKRLDDIIYEQRERIAKLEAVLRLALKQTEEPCPPFSWIRAAEIVLRSPQ